MFLRLVPAKKLVTLWDSGGLPNYKETRACVTVAMEANVPLPRGGLQTPKLPQWRHCVATQGVAWIGLPTTSNQSFHSFGELSFQGLQHLKRGPWEFPTISCRFMTRLFAQLDTIDTETLNFHLQQVEA